MLQACWIKDRVVDGLQEQAGKGPLMQQLQAGSLPCRVIADTLALHMSQGLYCSHQSLHQA